MNIKKRVFSYILAVVLASIPFLASAHVGYVLTEQEFAEHQGSDTNFLISGLMDAPKSAIVAGILTLIIVGIIIFIRTRPIARRFLISVREKLDTYHELLPWMARLSLGIALIGSGTAGAFISPVLGSGGYIPFAEILLGFMFLLGFLLTPAYIGAIALFFAGLSQDAYLFGNFDMLALIVSAFILSSPRPGLDDILQVRQLRIRETTKELVPLVLRIGLGVSFIFLAVYEKFLNPHGSELVVTTYNLMNAIPVPAPLWVLGAGTVECILGLLLLIGFEVRLVSLISFFVISLSFFYFKEDVYSHVTLFGAISMLIATGAGAYSLDRFFDKRREASMKA